MPNETLLIQGQITDTNGQIEALEALATIMIIKDILGCRMT